MDLQEVLTVSVSALVTVVLAHLAVFWVVRTLYPPPPKVIQVPVPMAMAPVVAPPQTYTPPAVVEQHVQLPTYPPTAPVEAPSEARKGPPPPEDTSIRRKPGVDGA